MTKLDTSSPMAIFEAASPIAEIRKDANGQYLSKIGGDDDQRKIMNNDLTIAAAVILDNAIRSYAMGNGLTATETREKVLDHLSGMLKFWEQERSNNPNANKV